MEYRVGTGKTVICLTDNFPLISPLSNINLSRFSLANLTLQGGSTGFITPKIMVNSLLPK
jgi:hypothetical protein